MSDIFGILKTGDTLGARLSAIQNTPISVDSCISIRPDNTISSFEISGYGKSLLQLTNLNGLIKLIQEGDSKVDVVDSGDGVVRIIVDNVERGVWDAQGLWLTNNSRLRTNTIQAGEVGEITIDTLSPTDFSTCGTDTSPWANVRTNALYTNSIFPQIAGGTIFFNAPLLTLGELLINNNIMPYTGGTPSPQDIGSNLVRFNNIYANNLHGNLYTTKIYNAASNNNYVDYQVLLDGSTSYNYLRTKGSTTNNLFIGASSPINQYGIVFIGTTDSNGADVEYIRNWYNPLYIYGASLSNRLLNIESNNIVPSIDRTYNLGHPSRRFEDIFSYSAPTHPSDFNLKTSIIETELGLDFINQIQAVQYKWKDGGSRTHYGFISQQIRDVLGHDANLNKFGMYVYQPSTSKQVEIDGKTQTITEEETFMLRYSEFISPVVKAIQELSKKVDNLENNTTVQGDTVILNQTSTPTVQSSSNNSKLETKVDKLIGRIFSLENRNVVEEESDGDFSIVDNLQSRVHSLEMLCSKLEKQNKKLTTVVNKLLKNV